MAEERDIIRWFGQGRGAGTWQNPAANPLSVTSDRALAQLALLTDSSLVTTWQGTPSPGGFVRIEFPQDVELEIRAYRLGVNPSNPPFPRSWALRGRLPSGQWVNLHAVTNSGTFNGVRSWHRGITGSSDRINAIEVTKTGIDSAGGESFNIAELELYGIVYLAEEASRRSSLGQAPALRSGIRR